MQDKKRIGILNQGKNNKFINNTFENFDIGIKDEGENSLAKGNEFLNSENIQMPYQKTNSQSWFLKNLIKIIVGIIIGLIVGFLIYKLGWN